MIPLIFGGASISGRSGGYGFGDISDREAMDLLCFSYEKGIRLFDSAPVYGWGESERRIGKAFRNREDVFVISKAGVTWDNFRRIDMTNEPKVVQNMLEESLRNLGRDVIDLYMVHWPDERVDIRCTLEVFLKAKERGMIKHIGLCNTSPEEMKKAREVASIDYVQSEFNLLCPALPDIFSCLNDTIFMSWGTLDKGILTRTVDRRRELAKDYHFADCRRKAPWWKQQNVLEKIQRLEPLWPFLREWGYSPLELALGHNLSWPECSYVLVGIKNRTQLEEVLAALNHLPDRETVEEARRLVHG